LGYQGIALKEADGVKNVNDYAGGCGEIIFGYIRVDCTKVGTRFGVISLCRNRVGTCHVGVYLGESRGSRAGDFPRNGYNK